MIVSRLAARLPRVRLLPRYLAPLAAAILLLAGLAPAAHASIARWEEQCGYGALGSGTTSWAVEMNHPDVVGGQRAPRERLQLRVDTPQAVVDRLVQRGGTDWEIEAYVSLYLKSPGGMRLSTSVPVRLQREGTSLRRLTGDGQLPSLNYPTPYGQWEISTWVITGDVRAVAPGGTLLIGSEIDEDGDPATGDMRCSGPAAERTLTRFDATPAPAVLHTPKPARMISLGDSYSSGEGRDSSLYDCGTDLGGYNVPLGSQWTLRYHQGTTKPYGTQAPWAGNLGDCETSTGSTERPDNWNQRPLAHYLNLCHRGGWAYPVQLRQALDIPHADGRSYACSGARTPQLIDSPQFPESPFGVTGGRTQLADALSFSASRGRPDLVTVGIGGNDAAFGDVVADLVKHCGGFESCLETPGWSAGRMRDAEQFAYKRLIWAFTRLRHEFGEGADPATIVAFGYPQVIGNVDNSCAATIGINRAERVWVKNEFLPALNRAVRDAATVAGIAYVDLGAATAGHELCTNDPAFHGIGIAHESVHPNERGHELITNWLTSANGPVNSDLSLDLGNPVPVPEAEVARPPAPARSAYTGKLEAPPAPPADADDACIGDRPRPANGCDLRVQGSGYAPSSQVRLTLQSSSSALALAASVTGDRDLGTVDVDAGGAFDVTRTLPGDLPAGDYALLLTGTAPDEQPQYGRLEFSLTEVGAAEPEPTTPTTPVDPVDPVEEEPGPEPEPEAPPIEQPTPGPLPPLPPSGPLGGDSGGSSSGGSSSGGGLGAQLNATLSSSTLRARGAKPKTIVVQLRASGPMTIRAKLIVPAKVGRSLKLKVPKKAKHVTFLSGSGVAPAVGPATIKLAVPGARRTALARAVKRRAFKATLQLELKSGTQRTAIELPVTIKR